MGCIYLHKLLKQHAVSGWGARKHGRDERARAEFGWPLFNSDDDGGRVTGKFLHVEAVLCGPSDLHVITQRGQSPEDVQGGGAAQ